MNGITTKRYLTTSTLFTNELNTTPAFYYEGNSRLENVKHNSWAAYKNIDLTGVKKATITAFIMPDMTVGVEVELHLDKPDGQLLGKVKVINPGSASVPTKLEAVEGVHDLYLVFKNEQAGDKNLFFLGSTKLDNK